MVSAAYAKLVHWRHILFLTPSGNDLHGSLQGCSVHMVKDLAWVYHPQGSHGYICIVPSKTAPLIKSPEACGVSTMMTWLFTNGWHQQPHYWGTHHTAPPSSNRITGIHCQLESDELMLQGKVSAALRIFTSENHWHKAEYTSRSTDHCRLWWVVKKTSTKTASTPRRPYLINNRTPRPVIHPVIFNRLDGASICTAALHTSGYAGSLGIDSTGWRCLWTSFHNASADFCNSLASVARKLCTTYVDPRGITPLNYC